MMSPGWNIKVASASLNLPGSTSLAVCKTLRILVVSNLQMRAGI